MLITLQNPPNLLKRYLLQIKPILSDKIQYIRCVIWLLQTEYLADYKWIKRMISIPGNDLFQDIRELLSVSLQTLLDHNEHMNFDKPIPGLTSFYDL